MKEKLDLSNIEHGAESLTKAFLDHDYSIAEMLMIVTRMQCSLLATSFEFPNEINNYCELVKKLANEEYRLMKKEKDERQ